MPSITTGVWSRAADPRVPQALARFEGFNVKAVVKAGHLALRVLLDSSKARTDKTPVKRSQVGFLLFRSA